ncbi:putative membrane protein [Arthrobacter sp. GAS37]|uniref:TMEM175 family protein n=1 Tax=Arthrobacter sp. GAS37 TaxID=3156261 RepID=UPI003836BCD1
MQTTRGLDRLVFFTDAVTAIAITLLVLPLVDSVTQAARDGLSAEQFIGNNFAAISGFALSFVVIARLWLAHHSTFEHVRSYSSPLLLLNLFWAFTVVVLPLPTEMVSQFRTSPPLGRRLHRDDGREQPHAHGHDAVDPEASAA